MADIPVTEADQQGYVTFKIYSRRRLALTVEGKEGGITTNKGTRVSLVGLHREIKKFHMECWPRKKGFDLQHGHGVLWEYEIMGPKIVELYFKRKTGGDELVFKRVYTHFTNVEYDSLADGKKLHYPLGKKWGWNTPYVATYYLKVTWWDKEYTILTIKVN